MIVRFPVLRRRIALIRALQPVDGIVNQARPDEAPNAFVQHNPFVQAAVPVHPCEQDATAATTCCSAPAIGRTIGIIVVPGVAAESILPAMVFFELLFSALVDFSYLLIDPRQRNGGGRE